MAKKHRVRRKKEEKVILLYSGGIDPSVSVIGSPKKGMSNMRDHRRSARRKT